MNRRTVYTSLFGIIFIFFSATSAFSEEIVLERMESAVINDIILLSEGDFILCGSCFGVPWVSRNNADGSIEWSRTFPEYRWGHFSGIASADNGSLLVWGTYKNEYNADARKQEALAVCLTSGGQLRWSETFSANVINEPLIAIPDGRKWTLFSVSYYAFPADHKDLNIVRFDARGRIVDQSTMTSDRWSDFPQAGSFGDGEASFVIFLKRPGLQDRPFEEIDEFDNWETFPDKDPYPYKPPDLGYYDVPRSGYDLAFMTLDGDGDIVIYDEYAADVDAVYDFAVISETWVAVAARYYESHFQHTGGVDVEVTEETDLLTLHQGSGNGDATGGSVFGLGLPVVESGKRRSFRLESAFAGRLDIEEIYLEESGRTVYRWWRMPPVYQRNSGFLIRGTDTPTRFVRCGGGWIGY